MQPTLSEVLRLKKTTKMKKMVFTLALALMSVATMAQNYIVVNSEKIFKSIPAYNSAIEALDKLAQSYQEQVDAKFEEVERLYNSYQQQKASLSATTRQQWEEVIAGRKSWNTSVSWLLLTEGALLRLLDTGLMVTVTIMTRDASVKLQGQALITNCHLTLTEGNLAQGSFAMRGSGPLAEVSQS